MTDETNRMTVKEAVEHLNDANPECRSCQAALAHLTALAEDYEKVKAEWDRRRVEYMDAIGTMRTAKLKAEAELAEANGMAKVADEQCEAAMREAEKVKATLAEIEYYGESPTMYEAKVEAYTKLEAKHETLKAEGVAMRRDYKIVLEQRDKAEAELENVRPLLDALMDKKMAMDWDCDELEDRIVLVCNGQDFLRAALAYRERKGEGKE